MLEDLRYALRQLKRSPGFAAAVVVTLALAIGVNTAVFSLMDGFLLRGLPYPQPERLAALVAPRGAEERLRRALSTTILPTASRGRR